MAIWPSPFEFANVHPRCRVSSYNQVFFFSGMQDPGSICVLVHCSKHGLSAATRQAYAGAPVSSSGTKGAECFLNFGRRVRPASGWSRGCANFQRLLVAETPSVDRPASGGFPRNPERPSKAGAATRRCAGRPSTSSAWRQAAFAFSLAEGMATLAMGSSPCRPTIFAWCTQFVFVSGKPWFIYLKE